MIMEEALNKTSFLPEQVPIGEFNESDAEEVCAIVGVLPESPKCSFLVKLSLEGSYGLTEIPSSFFEHMPILESLNLSSTSIKSLPISLPKLIALKFLILRNCQLFMELSPLVGELHNLEALDLDQTKILFLPCEVGKLSKLKILRVCFDEYDCDEPDEHVQQKALVHPGTISALSNLNELSIGVDPEDERWNETVQVVIEEACNLELLECLKLFLPDIEILGRYKLDRASQPYFPFTRFSFTIGQHKHRAVSRVPKKVEVCFLEWNKCLKFVKGKSIPSGMKRLLSFATAFYLDHHTTAISLCDFGIENIQELEFCILVDCNGMQYIVDGGEPYREQAKHAVEEDEDESSHSVQQHALPNVHYLHIYYLENLVSIWRFPTHTQKSLSGLKFLTLHKCPKLRVIFSPALLANLTKLEVLVLEDCPEVTSIVSSTSDEPINFASDYSLPKLEKVLLLYLPNLESIFSGHVIAPELEKIGFFNCPKLESQSLVDISSENLKVIKAESNWWNGLKWLESVKPLDHFQSIFTPILEDRDVMTQMEELLESTKHTVEKQSHKHTAEKQSHFKPQSSRRAGPPSAVRRISARSEPPRITAPPGFEIPQFSMGRTNPQQKKGYWMSVLPWSNEDMGQQEKKRPVDVMETSSDSEDKRFNPFPSAT